MEKIVAKIVEQLNLYYGNALLLALTVMAGLYLIAHNAKEGKRVIYPTLLIAVCIANPILYKVLFYKINLWQMFWMIPGTIIIALAFTNMVQDGQKIIEKIVVLVLVVGLFVWKGTNLYQNEEFTLIQNWEKKTETWTITQYASTVGAAQQMCYTLVDEEENVVIIDGGDAAEADWIRTIMDVYGNHVDAWIITNPRAEHAGAFNAIANDPRGITIDNIYTIDVNYDRYKETAQEDEFADYEALLEALRQIEESGASKIHYVQEGDEFEMINLEVKVLHAWDDGVDALSDNLCGNGSMAFVVSGHIDKMLFCSDTLQEAGQDMIDRHKKELDVDYVQVGNHGHSGLTTDFYQYTTPKAVFFDTTYIFDTLGEEGKNVVELSNYFASRGTVVCNFSTVLNQVVIR